MRWCAVESLEGRRLLAANLVAPIARPDHVVVVVLQDRASAALGDRVTMPYLNSVADRGLAYTDSHGVAHPSQPNLLALYSGSTQGVTTNAQGFSFPDQPNLAKSLFDASLSFSGFAENLPYDGSQANWSPGDGAPYPDLYVRFLNPMAQFGNVGLDTATGLPRPNSEVNRTFAAFAALPKNDYSALPTVSYVIPNNLHSTHGSNEAYPYGGSDDPDNNNLLRQMADAWLRDNLDSYLQWATTHNSLLIITQDEQQYVPVTVAKETITTVIAGDGRLITSGVNPQRYDHYNLLRTIENMYGLSPLGATASVAPFATDSAGRLAPNASAAVTAGGPYVIREGDALSLAAAGSIGADPSTLSYRWDINGDGVFADATGRTPVLTWPALAALSLGNGPAAASVRVEISDGQQAVVSPPATLTINNTAPTASIAGPADVAAGQAVSFQLNSDDPSTADKDAGFTYQFDWNGDGVLDQVTQGPAAFAVNHVFSAPGTYVVRAASVDRDGGRSTTLTLTIAVSGAAVVPDPANSSKSALLVGGTSGNDVIRVGTGSGHLKPTLNGISLGDFQLDRLIVLGQAGSDTLAIDGSGVSAILFGGAGDDTIFGGPAAEVLVGGDGADRLLGSDNRDLLIGGAGADQLDGGAGDDLLIAGSTRFDTDLAALSRIEAEWVRSITYSQRVGNLRKGAGGNASLALTAQSVTNDAQKDKVVGGAGRDWFWGSSLDDTRDRSKDELLN